jgi:RNA polymerase-binding protein DksA
MVSRQQQLEAEREELVSRLRFLREAVQIEVDTDPEEGDPELYEREKNLALIAALSRELSSIDDALRAIRHGTYGVCERCGEAIPPERLEVRPEATLCVRCQAHVERLLRRGIVPPGPARWESQRALDDSD